MKKIFALLMAGMIMLGVVGCGQAALSQENADVQGSHRAESTASENTGVPVVYMTTDISSDGLMAIYEALGASPEGSIAVKLSTGEPGSNYLRTDLIGELVQSLDASIVECNIFSAIGFYHDRMWE